MPVQSAGHHKGMMDQSHMVRPRDRPASYRPTDHHEDKTGRHHQESTCQDLQAMFPCVRVVCRSFCLCRYPSVIEQQAADPDNIPDSLKTSRLSVEVIK